MNTIIEHIVYEKLLNCVSMLLAFIDLKFVVASGRLFVTGVERNEEKKKKQESHFAKQRSCCLNKLYVAGLRQHQLLVDPSPTNPPRSSFSLPVFLQGDRP
jgi:hypothetical protein